MSDEIILERKGRVGSVTMQRPKALNALTQPMVVDLDTRLREWADDPAIAAVVIRGAAPETTTMQEIIRSVAPFIGLALAVVALLIAFPQLTLFLPGLIDR